MLLAVAGDLPALNGNVCSGLFVDAGAVRGAIVPQRSGDGSLPPPANLDYRRSVAKIQGAGRESSVTGELRIGHGVERGGPLYERVPTHDEHGRSLSDFMMLIPGLRDLPADRAGHKLDQLQRVLAGFREVVFADLNLPLNLLWVSVRARPGVILEIATTVKAHLPEALIVGHK
jgi:hypothetical protein